MRKTSLLLETDPTVSGQAPPTWVCTQSTSFLDDRVRIDLLFTMSDNTTPPGHEARWSRKTFSCGRAAKNPGWWSQTGSNRRPPACKAGALPTELWPLRGTEVSCRQSGKQA